MLQEIKKKKKKKKKKKTLFNLGQIFIFMEMAGMNLFALPPPLSSDIQKLPGIIDFLQMMFACTSCVTDKHVHLYFIRNM